MFISESKPEDNLLVLNSEQIMFETKPQDDLLDSNSELIMLETKSQDKLLKTDDNLLLQPLITPPNERQDEGIINDLEVKSHQTNKNSNNSD